MKAVSRREGWPTTSPQPPPSPHAVPVVPPATPPQVNEQLAGERSSLAQVLRQEFADRLAASEEENRQVRAELAELRARQRLELEQLTREKQAELEEVHGRWAAGLTGVLGSTGLGEAGGTLWLQRGRWAQEGEQAVRPPASFLPTQNWAPSPQLLQALCLRLCRPLCDAWPQSLGRSPANPSQGGCPMCGRPERSSLALSPLGLGGVGAMQKGWTPSTPYSPCRRGSLSPSLVPTCLPSVGALQRRHVVGASRPPLSREPFPRGVDSHGVSRGVTDPVIGFSRWPSAAVSRAGQGGQEWPLLFFGGWRPPTGHPAALRAAGRRGGPAGASHRGPPCAPPQGEAGPGKEGGGREQPPEAARGGSPRRPSLGERGWLGPDQGGRPVAGRDEEGRPPGGAARAAQAAVPECQVTADSSRLRAPGGKCSGRPSGGAPRLRRNSKEVSFNTLCDPDLSLLGWGLGWRGWRLLRARCEVTRPSFALGLPPMFPAWPCGSATQAPVPSRENGPLFQPGPGRAP